MTVRCSAFEAVRRFVLRTSGGRLGPFWRLAYRVVARLAALELARRYRASVVVRGSRALSQAIAERIGSELPEGRTAGYPTPPDAAGATAAAAAHLLATARAVVGARLDEACRAHGFA